MVEIRERARGDSLLQRVLDKWHGAGTCDPRRGIAPAHITRTEK